MNAEGKVYFLHAVKLVLRLVLAGDDHDLAQEILESEEKLKEKDQKTYERMQQNKRKHDVGEGCDMKAHIAASKIQQMFQARREKRRQQEQRMSQSKSAVDAE